MDENASKVWLVDIGLSQVHVIQDTVGVPPIVFVHGWYGLYPPCEQADPETYFDLTDDDLIAAGYSVGYAHLESSSCYTPPITENVWGLRKAIALTKAATHQSKVILIAHSMGGLVARAYIEGPDYAGDVSALFTFGSPHQGIPTDLIVFLANGLSLGVYCAKYQPAVCDFSTTGMLLFNQTHKKRADVDYHLISGDAPFSSRSAKGKIAYVLIDGPDDGIVPTSSGTGLAGTLDRGKTDEVHGEIFGTHTYFTRDGGQSVSYTQCLKKVLVDKTSAICGSISTQQTVVQDIPELPEHTPFAYGTLLPGQTTARTISIEGGPTVFATQWQTGTLAVTLVDPNGQVIDPSYALSHSSVVTYTADTTSAIYYLPNAVGGRWQLVLQATSVPTQGSTYTTFAAFSSPVALTDGTDRDQYTAGVTATITATLTGSPSSSEVTATILPTTGVTNTITLSPLGMEQYRGMYTVPNVPGYVEVRLVASGTTATGTSFERGRSFLFKISPTIYLPITRR